MILLDYKGRKQYNPSQGLLKAEERIQKRRLDWCDTRSYPTVAECEDGAKGPQVKECEQPPVPGKGKKIDSPCINC